MTDREPETEFAPNPMSRFSLVVSHITMWSIPVIVVAVGYEVVMRYGFSKSSTWVHDLSIWLGAAIYVISGLYAMQQRAHISISLIYDVVSRRVGLVLQAIALTVVIIFSFGFIAGAGPNAWGALMRMERIGTTWNPPVPGTVKPLIIVIVFLIAVQAVVNFIEDYRDPRPHRPATPPEVD